MSLIIAACAAMLEDRVPEQEMGERLAVCAEALSWLGTPYHSHGRVKGAGVDCGTILIEVFSACGLVPGYDPGDYAVDWHLHKNEELYLESVNKFARFKSNNIADALPGDVPLFKYGRTVSHSGLMLNTPTMIHAYMGRGVVLDDASNGEFPGRFVGLYSIWS